VGLFSRPEPARAAPIIAAARPAPPAVAPVAGVTVATEGDVVSVLAETPELRDELWGRQRPAVRYATRPLRDDEQAPLGASKIGGCPDLPTGTPWPVSRGSDAGRAPEPLTFFAQLELAPVAAHLDLGLPGDGLLLFFAACACECDSDVGRVFGTEGLADARVVHAPRGCPLQRYLSPRPADVVPEALVAPQLTWTLPVADEADVLDQLSSEFALADLAIHHPPDGYESLADHQLGGHPRFGNAPVEELFAEAAHANEPRRRLWRRTPPTAAGEVARWVVLLHLDSDLRVGLAFPLEGRAIWMAPRDDLAAADFSTVACTVDLA
jgi:uncharacterized protein YwqG